MKPEIPQWLLEEAGITAREWKQRKRRELKAAIDAVDALRWGCAHTPWVEGVYVGAIHQALRRLQVAWSQKEWVK